MLEGGGHRHSYLPKTPGSAGIGNLKFLGFVLAAWRVRVLTRELEPIAPRLLTSSSRAQCEALFPGNVVQILLILVLGIIPNLPVIVPTPFPGTRNRRGWAWGSPWSAKVPPRGCLEMCDGVIGLSQLPGRSLVKRTVDRPAKELSRSRCPSSLC